MRPVAKGTRTCARRLGMRCATIKRHLQSLAFELAGAVGLLPAFSDRPARAPSAAPTAAPTGPQMDPARAPAAALPANVTLTMDALGVVEDSRAVDFASARLNELVRFSGEEDLLDVETLVESFAATIFFESDAAFFPVLTVEAFELVLLAGRAF
jgi:hypothetical protein